MELFLIAAVVVMYCVVGGLFALIGHFSPFGKPPNHSQSFMAFLFWPLILFAIIFMTLFDLARGK